MIPKKLIFPTGLPNALAAFALITVLSACATRVAEQTPTTASVVQGERITIAAIEVVNGADVRSPELPTELEAELRRVLAARSQPGGRPAKLTVRIDYGRVASNAARFFAGAMVGRNRLMATVFVTDAATAAPLRQFTVDRSSNPGGFGAFYDQQGATARLTAEAIADQLFAPTGV
jgi:hypothetical protein